MKGLLGISIFLLLCSIPSYGSQLQARLLVSDSAPYVGEEITLTLEVDRPKQTGRLQPEWPPFKGFQVSEPWSTGTRTLETSEDRHRIEYRLRMIRPLTAGSFTISVGIKTADGTRHAEAHIPLTVLPLPNFGKPPGFQGAVGRPEMVLNDSGEGRRVVELILLGNIDLAAFPLPQPVLRGDSTLGLLTDHTEGRFPAEQTRRLQYFYDPRGITSGPGFRLPIFDPDAGSYEVVTVGLTSQSGRFDTSGIALLSTILLLTVFAIARRINHRRSVARYTDPGHYPSRTERKRHLEEEGVSNETLLQLELLWHRFDVDRFSQPRCIQKEDLFRDLNFITRRCTREIDKRRMDQALSKVINNFSKKEVSD